MNKEKWKFKGVMKKNAWNDKNVMKRFEGMVGDVIVDEGRGSVSKKGIFMES